MPQLNPEFFISQLFWLVVTFSFLLIFLWRISLPRIGSVLEKREKKINDDIATAKELQENAELIQKEIEVQLKDVRIQNSELIKNTSISLQEKAINELNNLDKNLNKKIEDSATIINKNKNLSMKKVEDQIFEITKLTLSKITNLQFENKDIKEALASVEKRIN